MSEQAEVIQILENIRAKRDLGVFAVEPKKSRKQRESAQITTPISVAIVTPVTPKSDSEQYKINKSSVPIPVIESSSNTDILKPLEKASPNEVTKKPKAKPILDTKNTELDFLQILPIANDDFSLDHNKRVYLNKDVFHKLSLLKIAGNVRNVSYLVNAIITHFFEENDMAIDNALKDLTT